MEISTVELQFTSFQVISVFLLFVASTNTATSDSFEDCAQKRLSKIGVYYSLQRILNALNHKKYQDNSNVRSLLTCYVYHCGRNPKRRPLKKFRHPFISIEGNFQKNNIRTSKQIANMIGAKRVFRLPHCLSYLRHEFANCSDELKWLFHSLSMYVNDFKIRQMLDRYPVIIIGYWVRHAAFNIAKAYPDQLPNHSSLYTFPGDLMVPDLILHISETTQILHGDLNKHKLNNEEVNFNKRLTEVYRRMRKPRVYELNSTVMSVIRSVIKNKLSPTFQHLIPL